MNWKDLSNRLKNPGTVMAITSLIILILTTNGIEIDDQRIMITVKSICGILTIIGIMNNAGTPGIDGISKNNKK